MHSALICFPVCLPCPPQGPPGGGGPPGTPIMPSPGGELHASCFFSSDFCFYPPLAQKCGSIITLLRSAEAGANVGLNMEEFTFNFPKVEFLPHTRIVGVFPARVVVFLKTRPVSHFFCFVCGTFRENKNPVLPALACGDLLFVSTIYYLCTYLYCDWLPGQPTHTYTGS